jgi:XapX domain-containing protein
MKPALGIIVGFVLGFACRWFGIPSPAPPFISGAFLVAAMTVGYTVTGHLMAARAARAAKPAASAVPGPRVGKTA